MLYDTQSSAVQAMAMSTRRLIFYTLLPLFIFLGIFTFFLDALFKKHGGRRYEIVTEISLTNLSRLFNYNSVVAEDRWMNKRILTRAIVDSVDDGFNNDTVIVSMNDGIGVDLECHHSRYEQSFRSIGRGRRVWIIGTLVGESSGLKMSNCSYYSNKPST